MNSNLPPNFTTHHPLIHSPLDISNDDGRISPGAPKFLVDQATVSLVNASGQFLIDKG